MKDELDFSGILDAHMPDTNTQNMATFFGVIATTVCMMLKKWFALVLLFFDSSGC